MKHQEVHPHLDVEGCFGCRVASVAFAASAAPSRSAGAAHAQWVNETEKRWHKDMAAYKRLVRDGVQPMQIDGCAEREARANTREQVES
jgi:hypothetical protein